MSAFSSGSRSVLGIKDEVIRPLHIALNLLFNSSISPSPGGPPPPPSLPLPQPASGPELSSSSSLVLLVLQFLISANLF